MLTALLLSAAVLGAPPAAEGPLLAQFSHRPGFVPVGEVFHFRKSNLDGSQPAIVSVYFASPDRLDVLKAESVGRRLARVEARIDWSAFSVAELVSWNGLETGRPARQAELRLDPATRVVEARAGEARGRVEVPELPVALYNFDLLGVAAVWPHLVRPAEPVRVAIVDPVFGPEAATRGILESKGLAVFTPEAEEEHGGVPCRRYAVSGPAFGGRTGTLWADARTGQWVEFRHPVPDNPGWTSFRLELVEWERRTPAEWEAFVDGRVQRAAGLVREFGED